MATCPHCREFLNWEHRCRVGPWRERRKALGVVVVGAAMGSLMSIAIASRPTLLLASVTAAWGAVLCWSFWRYGRLS